jgi:hypothetical protein
MVMSPHYERDLFETPRSPDAAERLRRHLAEAGRCRVELIPTRNRVSMISVAFVTDGHARIRLHEQFLAAPAAVRDALAAYLRTRRRADWAVVADYARRIHVHAAARPATAARRLPVLGKVHDLREIAAEVNARFFSGQIRCQTGWGTRRARDTRRRTRSRSIRNGSWSASTRTVRINPLLDDTRVPRDFVAYIVFHEMLHAAVPGEHVRGRRMDHGPLFRKLERQYPELARIRQMAKDLLHVLLEH